MYIQELKAIELCLRYMSEKKNLNNAIHQEFEDTEDFNKAKMNMYNFTSIITILSNQNISSYNFDASKFLTDGTSLLNATPLTKNDCDFQSTLSPNEIITQIINSFKNNEFSFDEFNNIIISNPNLDIIMSPEWLRRLAENIKNSQKKQIYLFNKNYENNIYDEKSLLNYLYHTKTFLVSANDPSFEFDSTYEEELSKVHKKFANTKKVKAEDIQNTLQKRLAKKWNAKVEKYTIPNYTYLLQKAAINSESFYNMDLESQKSLISDWLLEMESGNTYNMDQLRNFLLALNKIDISQLQNEVDLNACFIGLFSLYITTLLASNIDPYEISITKFNINKYISSQNIKVYTELKKIIKQINNLKEQEKAKDSISSSINAKMNEINTLRDIENETLMDQKIAELGSLITQYKKRKSYENSLEQQRNSYQSILQYNQQHSLEDIAFENDRILTLIENSILNGRIYFDAYNKNKIVIETFNKEAGLVEFKTTISVSELLTLIENINYYLEDDKHKKSTSF